MLLLIKYTKIQSLGSNMHKAADKTNHKSGQKEQNSKRSNSNSGDNYPTFKKLKNSSSNTSTNKFKNTMAASMANSLRKSRCQNKSNNKKDKLPSKSNTSSAKTFKTLTDVTSALNMSKAEKPREEPAREPNVSNGGGSIHIKSIKQKVAGSKHQMTSSMNNTRVGLASNETHDPHKSNAAKDQKTIKKYYCPKDPKKNMTLRENSVLITSKCQTEDEDEVLSLNNFSIGRKLGKGRFGDVFLAREIRTGFLLAIKMVNKKELKQSQMEKQLMQQIKIQSFCNHPNILKMYGFFDDRTKIYLLLELATNGCLFKQIRKVNYFSENLSSFYFRQIANGTRYLHSNAVIHRDIKPENILNCFNVLKICDFGWSIYSPIYQRQTFCGTLDYVPPEIVTGEFYDEKVDVWCLGVLCYELVTGKAPFESKVGEMETYDKILKVDIQFPIYLSPEVVDFINKILNRDPGKRLPLEHFESQDWMRKYQNEAGRMICKEIWDAWINLLKM